MYVKQDKPVIRKVGGLYRKVTEVWYYKPSALEVYFYYGGTNSGLNPDNVYARRSNYSTRTYYEPAGRGNPAHKAKPTND